MTTTVSDALARYLGSAKESVTAYAQKELHRFGRALGWERPVDLLAPPEVATYAEGVVAAGGDVHGRLTPVKEFLAFLKKQGLSSHSLAPHVKIPRAASRSAPSAVSTNSEIIRITEDGHVALVAELDGLKGQRGPIAETIGIARADGDVSDNSPLEAARELQGKTEGRIRELEEMLRRTEVVKAGTGSGRGGIRIGSQLVLHDITGAKDTSYTLVDTAEADPTAGKISQNSPIGKAVLGRKKGDEVTIQAPRGDRRVRIVSVGG